MKRNVYHDRMAKRRSKKASRRPARKDFASRLRQALERRTKDELVDALVEFAEDDRAVLRRLTAHFDLQMPVKELLVVTRQAIADATAFDERNLNDNFSYDYDAYAAVQRNLQLLIEAGHLRPAMALSLELMEHASRQVQASDEGLMTEDIEACLKPVIQALRQCDLPAADVRAWATQMIKRDRVEFICDRELLALRNQFQTPQSV